MYTRDIIVCGGSAGGIEALSKIIGGLPAGLPAALLLTIHISPDVPSLLPEIVTGMDSKAAVHPEDGEKIEHGRIYVAPPDMHLLVEGDRIRLSHGPKVNLSRPSIDSMFSSAAESYGRRVIGVVLSGGLSDGTAGLAAIKKAGGIAIVQDPGDTQFPSMPMSAIENVNVDFILPADKIASKLVSLVLEQIDNTGEPKMKDEPPTDGEIMSRAFAAQIEEKRLADSSVFTCPECGGVLWEMSGVDPVRYRCHVGHILSVDTLLEGITEGLESTLWSVARRLQEKATLHRRIALSARNGNQSESAAQHERLAEKGDDDAHAVLRLLMRPSTSATDLYKPETGSDEVAA